MVHEYAYNARGGGLLSLVIGFISSVVGIGGGILYVPALVYLFDFPAHVATATSLLILAVSAGIGTASHLAPRHALVVSAVLVGVGVLAGAQLGAAIFRRIRGRLLTRLLSLTLAIVGVRLVPGALVT